MAKQSLINEFTKNFLKLVSGNIIVLALPIFTAPINSRNYDPKDYGTLGLFLVFVGFFAAISTSGFNHGIIVASRKRDVSNFFNLSIYTTCVSVFLAFVTVLLACVFNFVEEYRLLFLILVPFHVLLQSFIGILQTLINKHGRYGILTKGRIVASVSAASIQILLGFLGFGFKGLLITYITSSVLMLLYYFVLFRNDLKTILRLASRNYSGKLMRSNLKYIKYTAPADIINTFVHQIPVYVFSQFFNVQQFGAYVFSERLLGMPFSVMSGAFMEVFRKNASDEMEKFGNCREAFLRTLKLLLVISVPVFLVIGFASPILFEFVFGSRWILAGQIASALSLMYFSRFVVSPLTYVFFIKGKQKEDFILHLLMPVWILGILFSARLLGAESIVFLVFLYSISVTLIYILYFYKSFKYSK